MKDVDTIINGHIPVSSWNDLKEYQQFLADFAAFADKEMKAGKTVDQAAGEFKLDPKYKKVVRRSIKFHAHDEQNAANVGDVVRVVETRPLSKDKRWRVVEIVERAR